MGFLNSLFDGMLTGYSGDPRYSEDSDNILGSAIGGFIGGFIGANEDAEDDYYDDEY